MAEFDTATPDEIHQREITMADEMPMPDIPVSLAGTVRAEEMPGQLGACRNVILTAGSRAEQILTRDPRRKKVFLWPTISLDSAEEVVICIAATENDANDFRGAIIQTSVYSVSRYEFSFADELWARPGKVTDTAGIFNGIIASSDDTILSVLTERWTH